jgi:hypothetical protein
MELVNKIVVAACAGCKLIVPMGSIAVCRTWASPYAKQRVFGGCPSQTNRKVEVKEVKVTNALKASKRAAAGK